MIVKLLTEHHLEFLSLKAGCRGSSESTLVEMSNCWKFQALAQLFYIYQYIDTTKQMAYTLSVLLLDFSLTLKAATLIFICGRGSAISSAKEGKSGFIYNLVKS